MPDELETQGEPGTAAPSADEEWQAESHSEPMTAPPVDTTLEPVSTFSQEVKDARESQPGPGPSGEQIAIVEPKIERGRKVSAQARINELTRARHDAERQSAELAGRVRDLEARLSGATAVPPVPAVAVPSRPVTPQTTVDIPPEPPLYVNFDTDEDYRKAVGKWRGDLAAWQTNREDKLKYEIASGVAMRLDRERRQSEITSRFTEMRRSHPDFDQLVDAGESDFRQVAGESSIFIQDLVVNTPEGAQFLYELAKSPQTALALGQLPLPSRPLADAVRSSPIVSTLMMHFATDQGRQDFMRLRTIPEEYVKREVAYLEAHLSTAASGPASGVVFPITNAAPPVKPPVGTPRARVNEGAQSPTGPFEEWMATEDAREREERRQSRGLPASA